MIAILAERLRAVEAYGPAVTRPAMTAELRGVVARLRELAGVS
jgi:hypothetical protein